MKTIKNFRLTGLIFGLIFMVSSANAAFLIEPHIGYNISGGGEETISNIKVEYDYTGPQFGARMGYQNLGFMAGVDYTRSSYEYEVKIGNITGKEDYDRNEIGIFAGYNFPILLRAWGTYYFSNKSEDTHGFAYSGNTKELGLGFTALPFLSINVMYRMVTFDEFDNKKLSPSTDLHEIVLGVSLPLTL